MKKDGKRDFLLDVIDDFERLGGEFLCSSVKGAAKLYRRTEGEYQEMMDLLGVFKPLRLPRDHEHTGWWGLVIDRTTKERRRTALAFMLAMIESGDA